jgi:hypothetical protein
LFVESAIQLYSDPVAWSHCALKGHQLLKEKFDSHTNARILHDDLVAAMEAKIAKGSDGLSLDDYLFRYNSWKHHELFSRLVQLKDAMKKKE